MFREEAQGVFDFPEVFARDLPAPLLDRVLFDLDEIQGGPAGDRE
jgi:hypothetical protein